MYPIPVIQESPKNVQSLSLIPMSHLLPSTHLCHQYNFPATHQTLAYHLQAVWALHTTTSELLPQKECNKLQHINSLHPNTPYSTHPIQHTSPSAKIGFIPQNRKRNGSISYSTKTKYPHNTSNVKSHVYTASHSITGFKHNVDFFQDPNNTLDNISAQIDSKMCNSRECRLVIFIADFLLDFSVPVEATKDKIYQIYHLVESKGHITTLVYLPYVPAISNNPKTKFPISPSSNHTNYLVTLNNRLQVLASANPIKQDFSNKLFSYNHEKDNYKASSWQGLSSTASPHLRFSSCFTYTPRELITRSTHFFNHVEKFITSLK